jgi:catechol 2,3-dioxygenase-like lactoylglutathione lyase family enzyme
MIGYVTLGTNDLPRAAKFYDSLLGEVGARRFRNSTPSSSGRPARMPRGSP